MVVVGFEDIAERRIYETRDLEVWNCDSQADNIAIGLMSII